MAYDPYEIGSAVYDVAIEPFLSPIKHRTTHVLQKKFNSTRSVRVLEVACGTGTQSRLLAGRGFHVAALDKSPGMIKQAYKKRRIGSGSLESIQGDAARMPFPHAVFDAVIFQMALHEMKETTRRLSMNEMMRVSKDDAIFVFADFVPANGFSVSKYILAVVERMAGLEHYRNGRQFLNQGGLLVFLKTVGLLATPVRHFFQGNVCLAVAGQKPLEFSNV